MIWMKWHIRNINLRIEAECSIETFIVNDNVRYVVNAMPCHAIINHRNRCKIDYQESLHMNATMNNM